MPLPYGFISLDESQLQRRRHLLDFYGQAAQLSAFLVLLAFQLPFVLAFLLPSRSSPQKPGKEHASPIVSRFGEQSTDANHDRVPVWRRLNWVLDQHLRLEANGPSWDYLHLTKRFGIIGASQLPLHYLLALKSSWSPITYLTRLSHEELNPYHRALGRIILLFVSLHASFYLNFFIQKSLLTKRIRDPDVILGLLAITTFLTVGTTALAWVRKKNYFLFFVIHVATSIFILPVLYFHVSHLRIYILESAIIYIILIAQRNISVRTIPNAKLTHLSNNLLSITIPLPPSYLSSNNKFKKSHPGQHIYLSLPSHSHLRLNPFTIANLPQKDNHIRLIIRSLNGTTRILSDIITSSLTSPNTASLKTTTIPLKIEGPYGSAATFPDLTTYSRILLVAGGVGATFTIPIYRHLLNLHPPNRQSKIQFIWSVKSLEDAAWAFPYLDQHAIKGMEIYISKKSSGSKQVDSPLGSQEKSEEEHDEGGEGIELQEREGLLSLPSSSSASSPPPQNLTTHPGRPDLAAIVNETFSSQPNDTHPPNKIAILVCGPAGMGAALRREVGVWVRTGREVWWHNEEFGW
ncbi:MAG: hypothetical protein Q9176_002672 [Flavoplaca citrina]